MDKASMDDRATRPERVTFGHGHSPAKEESQLLTSTLDVTSPCLSEERLAQGSAIYGAEARYAANTCTYLATEAMPSRTCQETP